MAPVGTAAVVASERAASSDGAGLGAPRCDIDVELVEATESLDCGIMEFEPAPPPAPTLPDDVVKTRGSTVAEAVGGSADEWELVRGSTVLATDC